MQSQRYRAAADRHDCYGRPPTRCGSPPARLHSLNVTVQRLNRPQHPCLTAALETVWSFLQNHIEFHIKDNNNFTESPFREEVSPVTVPQCSRLRVNGQFVWTFCASPRAGRPGPVRAGPGRSGRAGDINIISVTARLRSGAARFVSVCEMFKVLTILQTEVLVRPSELLILFWDRIIDSN